MKILAPISSPDEVEMLVESGADELYCGVVPPEWMTAYSGAIWLNRRSPAGANLASYDALATLVGHAHGRGVPVFLTLNAPSYNASQLQAVARLAGTAIGKIGVDALIVSDVGLLLTLAELGIDARIHISSVASTLNREAIEFYRRLGASRIILPRSLSLAEIGALAAAAAGSIELEAFVLNDGCAFEEGLCHTTHHHRVGAFCWNLRQWAHQTYRDDGRSPAEAEARAIDAHLDDYREWLWYINGCGGAVSPCGLPDAPCGLCAIPDFARMGLASVKIAGREASPLRKLLSLRLVKAVVDEVRRGAAPDEVRARARRIRNDPGKCDLGYMCYYRTAGP